MIKILFTSVGRRVELIQAYKKAAAELDADLIVYGADITESAPALLFCDKKLIVKRIHDPDYVPDLLKICSVEKIDALIPTIDTDLLLLSENRKSFLEVGTKVLIGSADKVRLCRDKRLTADYFISCGLKSPIPVDDYTKYDGKYPAFIKPKDGSSSIDAYKVNNLDELITYSSRVNDYIVQPFIEGTEYTVDVFCDLDGEPVFITSRERNAVRSGEVLKTTIRRDESIIEECKRLLADFKPVGAITIQLIKQNDTGDNYYIEINPRYGGGAPLSMKAGADSAKACIRMLMGETVGYISDAASDGEIYSRFDQSICINKKNVLTEITDILDIRHHLNGIRAVIFDLDDTLYSEKEYIRSGFNAVAEHLGNPIYADRLWHYFEDDKPAINALLEELEQTDRQSECIDIYRKHKPDICLYDGIIELIGDLKINGYEIGIITDGRPEGQHNKLEVLGLNKLIDDIIITDELGGTQFRKPCDIAFRIIQKRWELPFEQIVYTGDNISKDYKAPQQLGMKFIYFNNSDGLY